MNDLKGPSVAQSDNLNPWDWKRERAPRTRNTAPAASSTQVTFDRREALHNQPGDLGPQAQGQMVHYGEAPTVVSREGSLAPEASECINTQIHEPVKANAATDLGPQVLSRESIGVQVASTLTNETSLAPTSSPELLKGYKERFFLKQDGYDDP